MIDQIVQIAKEMGWEEIFPQKNPVMISFQRDKECNPRVNVYYTTMTVSVQYKDGYNNNKAMYHKDVSLRQFREILQEL